MHTHEGLNVPYETMLGLESYANGQVKLVYFKCKLIMNGHTNINEQGLIIVQNLIHISNLRSIQICCNRIHLCYDNLD